MGHDVVGVPAPVLYRSDEEYDAVGRVAAPLLSQGKPFQMELYMRRRDGSDIWVNLIGYVLNRGDPREGTIWIAEDRSAVSTASGRSSAPRWRRMPSRLARAVSRWSRAGSTPISSSTWTGSDYGGSSSTSSATRWRPWSIGPALVIYMYHREHGLPHFHAVYGEHEAVIGIRGLRVLEGQLPRRALALVRAWGKLHGEELERDWELARDQRPLRRIAPLA